MSEIVKDVRQRIKIVPDQVTVVEDWYYTYAWRRCERKNIETPVVKAVREPNFIPGSFATPDVAAHPNGADVCHGLTPVPAGAGTETMRHSN